METLTDLIEQAQEMYLDRPRDQADLIRFVASLDCEARAALVLAYDILYREDK